jgi:septation ring formation regulator EzrA
MAQSISTNPLLNYLNDPLLNNLDEEINAAETTFDLSALTTQVLLALASQLTRSADQLSEVATSTGESAKNQGEITKKVGELAWHLGQISAHSEHLKGIAEKSGESAWHLGQIAKRGDHDCPLHVTIGERPVQVFVELHEGARDALRIMLTEICDQRKVEGSLDLLGSKVDHLHNELTKTNGRLDVLGGRLDHVHNEQTQTNSRFDAVRSRVDHLYNEQTKTDGRLQHTDQQLQRFQGELDNLGKQIAQLEEFVRQHCSPGTSGEGERSRARRPPSRS